MITRVLIELQEDLAGKKYYRVEVSKDGTPVSVKAAPASIHRALEIAREEVTFSPTAESVRAFQVQQPVNCPMGNHPIFVRADGLIVTHYNASGKRCTASETQYRPEGGE